MSRGRPQFQPQRSHLILEQLAQRLEQLEVQRFRQPADVVVGLDRVRLLGLGPGRFDHIRIDGALRQPLHVGQLGCLPLEHVDEQPADDLALGLGSETPASAARNSALASTCITFTPRFCANCA
jgi:hypothetical protein